MLITFEPDLYQVLILLIQKMLTYFELSLNLRATGKCSPS